MDWIIFKPFSKEGARSFTVKARMERTGLSLFCQYLIDGDTTRVLLPKRNSNNPTRMNGLWETTCFELFLKNKNSPNYLEFNFSTSGNWNAFSFSDYRSGMLEFGGISKMDIRFNYGPGYLGLDATLHLKEKRHFLEEDFDDGRIKACLCAVVENTQNEKSYWAVSHLSNKPDFHNDDNFTLKL